MAPLDPLGRRDDGGGGDARGAPTRPGSTRRDAARPDAARLRLPERRAGGVPGPGRPGPDRAVGAAAAFDREAFLAAGGFDENLFAYWEDVDLVLRMRAWRGALRARRRRASASTTTRPRSGRARRRKNYLTGFGRGYVLRKWGVLRSPARAAQVLVTDGAVCAGQMVVDRSLAGVRGRVRGYRAATPGAPFPERGACGRGRRGRDAADAWAAGVEAGPAPGSRRHPQPRAASFASSRSSTWPRSAGRCGR